MARAKGRTGHDRDDLRDTPVLWNHLTPRFRKQEPASHSDQFGQLIQALQELGQKLLHDQRSEMSVHYFRLAVEGLREITRIRQDKQQELNLCLSSGQAYATGGFWRDARFNYDQAVRLYRELLGQIEQEAAACSLRRLEIELMKSSQN